MTSRRTKRARKYVSLREKLAAALSMLLPQEQRDELRDRKAPAKSVISLFDQDHVILHALGGEDRWWNLTPMLRAAHREKARRDTSIVAKHDRVTESEREHMAAMARKLVGPSPFENISKPRAGIPSRGFAKGHRPLRSGGSFQTRRGESQ